MWACTPLPPSSRARNGPQTSGCCLIPGERPRWISAKCGCTRYKGSSDGLTTALRDKFPAKRYVGIELEVNQALAIGPARRFTDIPNRIARSLALLIGPDDD
jgi:hypothetical protein